MKKSISPPTCVSAALALALLFPVSLQSEDRTWTSTTGSTMRGEIVGVKDGKALIRPVTPPKAVPISSLSKRDQEYIEQWQKDEAERIATARAIELERHMNTPLLKGLKGNLQRLDEDDKLVPYEPRDPGKLNLIAIYYSAATWDGKQVPNPVLKDLSKLYSRMLRRYSHFEVVLYPLDTRETDVINFMKEEKITFPVMKHSEVMKEAGMAVRQPFPGTIPALILLDRTGKMLVNSADRSKGKPTTWSGVLDAIEDEIKDRKPKEEDDE